MDKKVVKKIAGLFTLLTVALISQNTFSQLVTINVELDTNQILIGDQVNMQIEVIKSGDASVIFPAFEENLTDEIEIVNISGIDSAELEDYKTALYQNLTITAFDSGLLYIPPVDFLYISKGFTDTISSSANYLEVFPVKIDTTGTIRDIKGLYKAPYSLGELYPYILALIFIGLLVWFIIYYIEKKKKDEPILRKVRPPEMPHIIALRELDKLKAEKLWQQNKVKLYYTRLTEIVRTYIERRFEIMAMEETTSEILNEFQEREIENVNYSILEQLLNLADLVKFAKSEPLPDENITHMDNAYAFVKNTKYQPVEQELTA
ncbi:MAG: hypothetical protein JSV22_10500 [Bacteroidales bacterium]|nr:MAG: hypothetical protein JSV22_10500 [Bacteroidales bacterium]